MKRIIISLLICILLLSACASSSDKPTGPDGTAETTETTEDRLTENAATEPSASVPGTSSENASDRISAEVISENIKGCFYGENTGTDKTYTGLEPLPLTDFPTAELENASGKPDTVIEHGYGVAQNEIPHDISKNNQRFFDNGGYNALALDNKSGQKTVYLTFDCGYENGYTSKILDVLRDKGVKAAFFCTLPEMKENPELIARMINEGHIVGNHSVTHPNFAGLTRREMYDEVKGFDDYIREHFGYSSLYFRYPQGKYSENSLSMLNSMGYKCVFWSLAYVDWELDNQKGSGYAHDTVISRIHPGAVMLLHSVSPDNANALGSIIDTARDMGYEFRLISEA